jgi:hypothetical protein
MKNNRLTLLSRGFLQTLVCCCLVFFAGQQMAAQGGKEEKDANPRKGNVFVYPVKLTEKDKLVDGPGEKASVIQIRPSFGLRSLTWQSSLSD